MVHESPRQFNSMGKGGKSMMMNGTGNGHAMTREQPEHEESQHEESHYQVAVSIRFVVTSLLASSLLAFCLGKAARSALLGSETLEIEQSCSVRNAPALPDFLSGPQGAEIPQSRYLSKNFDTSMSASSSSWLAASRETVTLIEEQVDSSCPGGGECDVNSEPEDDDEDEENVAMADHLMVDIRNVNAEFLNSERQLADAMLEVVRAANLTMLSYHCHGLIPAGVSCVGVLTRNYVSFHTWPVEGVITLDICTGDSKSLLPVVPVIQRAFGIPRRGVDEEKPKMYWMHKIRGFRQDYTVSDVDRFVMTGLTTEVKELVESVRTDFQTIDVFDFAEKAQELENVYDRRPDRHVYLDGSLQSTLLNEAVYHEALVHPGLFAHANPKRVAIVGGGECATLREVLKHDRVEEAIMIEIDEKMVNESRRYMPEWSDCSDIEGSTPWCGDDPRASMYYEDALAWFLDRYSEGGSKLEESPGQIDVIIMDALDPESEVPFAEALYSDETFMQSFFDSLGHNGILIMQLGESPNVFSPDETYSKFKNRVVVLNMLEKIGFKSIHVYEEGACAFGAPWTFIVAFKAYSTRKRWLKNEAEVNLRIRKRAKRMVSGRNPFLFFDGATMQTYQVPPRQVETNFCRRRPTPHECIEPRMVYNPEIASVPLSSLEVRVSEEGKIAGRGVYTKVDIPPHTYVAPEGTINALRFYPYTYRTIMELYEEGPLDDLFADMDLSRTGKVARDAECLQAYMHGYGFTRRTHGTRQIEVDSTILMFVNHGCEGEYNVGIETEDDEFSADPDYPIEALNGKSHAGTSIYNPVVDRHLYRGGDLSLDEEIDAGEEILDNYLAFVGSEDEWEEDIEFLRDMCNGKNAKGSVTDYEERFGKEKGLR